jgi:ABC-type dipeptide/oligopeptide/nickel transport system ATPase subunit
MRIALARALFIDPTILLLGERGKEHTSLDVHPAVLLLLQHKSRLQAQECAFGHSFVDPW